MMKRSLFVSAAALAALAIPATASAQGYGYNNGYAPQNTQCERQRSNDKVAGGVAGALVGALAGGAIGNNIDAGDDYYYVPGRRGHHGHGRGRGRGGYYYSEPRSNSGQVAVGAVLGAVVGGLAGSSLAAGNNDCQSTGPTPYQPAAGYNGNGYYESNGYNGAYQGSSIPRTTDGLYGGPEVMQQPRYPASQPPARTYPASAYPTSGYPGPDYGNQGYNDQGYSDYDQGYSDYQDNSAYSQQECRQIYMNGGHVMACRNSPTETWRPVGNNGQQGDELYGGY
tara:strand:+ start:4547 stop:5392 length:846 start_codon:yes stop_codon:yes gene_type:complete